MYDKYFKLYEFTYKDIRSSVDSKSRARSKILPSGTTFYKFIEKDSTYIFRTESQTFPGTGLYWYQSIKLVDLPLVLSLDDEDLTNMDRVRLAIAGDLLVNCDCPAFLYWGYSYIMTQLGANEDKAENRFPKIRNPNLRGSVCKHLDSALVVLPFNADKAI
jgi:hypothetical protein